MGKWSMHKQDIHSAGLRHQLLDNGWRLPGLGRWARRVQIHVKGSRVVNVLRHRAHRMLVGQLQACRTKIDRRRPLQLATVNDKDGSAG